MHIQLTSLVAVVSTTLLWASCSNEQGSGQGNNGQMKQVFVHGTPEQLLLGTQSNGESFLVKGNLKQFQGFEFSSGIVLTEFTEINDPQKNNKNSGQRRQAINRALSLTQTPTGLGAFAFRKSLPSPADPEGEPELYEFYDTRSGQIALRGRVTPDRKLEVFELLGLPIDMVHYSVAHDRRTMSFLGRLNDSNRGASLVAVSFSQRYRNAQQRAQSLGVPSGRFTFLGGKRTAYRWDTDPITLNVCLPGGDRMIRTGASSDTTQSITSLVQEAWNSWLKGGRAGNRPASLEVRTVDVPPFSDVNTRCLYSVPQYAFEASNSLITTGLTLPMVNHSLGTIENSAVFLFEQAIARVPDENSYLSTAIHEIGHYFGLGHEFSKDQEGRYTHLSAMGYNENRTLFPSDHDFAALRELYGAIPPSALGIP